MTIRRDQLETDPLRQLYDRIQKLEAQVEELRAARRLEAAAIGQGGITVKDGGGIRVYDAAGNLLGALGHIGTNEASQDVYGVWLGRADGSTALAAWGTGQAGDTGFVGMYDLSGNYVVTDDTESRRGLARPYLPLTVGEISPPTATTTSGTFADVASGINTIQHPVMYAHLLVRASDGTTAGEVRLALNSTGIGPTLTVAAGAYTFATIGPFTVPDPGAYGTVKTLAVQARRTAGTGTVGVRVMSILGLESSWA